MDQSKFFPPKRALPCVRRVLTYVYVRQIKGAVRETSSAAHVRRGDSAPIRLYAYFFQTYIHYLFSQLPQK
jgi:hypothetical protein